MITGISIRELDQIAIGKYVCTVILACLKNQVEKYYKIDNYVNNQNSKTYKYNLIRLIDVLYSVLVNNQPLRFLYSKFLENQIILQQFTTRQ